MALAGCKPENKFVAPPPSEVSVAKPLQQNVRPFIELTGNTAAFNTVDLVARVEGFLDSIDYKDGAFVKKGDLLFQIEPITYDAKVKQAEAELASAKAQLVQAQAEFVRQETLLRQNVSAQNTYDQAKAKRDSAQANVENNQANLVIAQTNLGYTKVAAPFDGIVTHHLVSVGELVGAVDRDQARDHRPARPDLRDLQHERAGGAGHPRQAARGRRQSSRSIDSACRSRSG